MVLVNLYLKSRQYPNYRKRWKEHFGIFKSPKFDKSIWVHAVSVGESLAAVPIIKQLLVDYPEYKIVVTTTTPTGAERINAVLGDQVHHFYSPYDLPWVVIRYIRKINPSLTIIMETELWPNFIFYSHKQNIPVVVVNARLSAKSARKYAQLTTPTNRRWLVEPITHIACQNVADAERFKMLGTDDNKLSVTGSIKFDLQLPANIGTKTQEMFGDWGSDSFVWVAGSTHVGEDEVILQAHRYLIDAGVNAKLIIVPRHPERFDSVSELIVQRGFSLHRRTESISNLDNQEVYMCDTMGELMYCYKKADVAFVAGSLVERGGHNPLEPAALKKPVLSGPHTFNFADVYQNMIDAGAAKIVEPNELAKVLEEFSENSGIGIKMGHAGIKVVEANRGAVSKTINLLRKYID